ncbi:hypothetical protein NPIL_298031 [Nephila pilipes]|uniref:Uncharacterized protein n=1 Tax=Nephila pilipes TaxID=299642 RepID=A0A8X6KMG3_NEPPI|nr:hypothetical protein NPIL_298031 [Nephila pilipes]
MKVIEIRYCVSLACFAFRWQFTTQGLLPFYFPNTVKSTSFNSSLGSNLSLCCALSTCDNHGTWRNWVKVNFPKSRFDFPLPELLLQVLRQIGGLLRRRVLLEILSR